MCLLHEKRNLVDARCDLHKEQKSKPILIAGQAMEYYDMRKSGKDIDFVITDKDYQNPAEKFPKKRKDLYGDLGVTVDQFEI